MPGYFASFGGFQENEEASFLAEFKRLALQQGWSKKSKTYGKEYKKAIQSEFNRFYIPGSASNLQAWQDLCEELSVSSLLPSIKKCKEALRKVHINLVDLVDSRRRGEAKFNGPRFKNAAALSAYTLNSGKIFPKEQAKKEGYIKALLRHIY